jgi:hypothetical protein
LLLQFDEQKEPFKVQLTTAPKRMHHPLRAAKDQTLPPFLETWVSCNSHATGLSLIRPSRRRDLLVQAKNGVKTLPPSRETFLCLFANFGSSPKTLTKGQVLEEAESVSLWQEGKIEMGLRQQMNTGDEWEGPIRDSVPHLTDVEKDQLMQTLTPFSDMWEGKLGCISAFKTSQYYVRSTHCFPTVSSWTAAEDSH